MTSKIFKAAFAAIVVTALTFMGGCVVVAAQSGGNKFAGMGSGPVRQFDPDREVRSLRVERESCRAYVMLGGLVEATFEWPHMSLEQVPEGYYEGVCAEGAFLLIDRETEATVYMAPEVPSYVRELIPENGHTDVVVVNGVVEERSK